MFFGGLRCVFGCQPLLFGVFCVPAGPLGYRTANRRAHGLVANAPSPIAAAIPAGNPWRREREAVRLSATDAHRQPMPKLAEAWATS